MKPSIVLVWMSVSLGLGVALADGGQAGNAKSLTVVHRLEDPEGLAPEITLLEAVAFSDSSLLRRTLVDDPRGGHGILTATYYPREGVRILELRDDVTDWVARLTQDSELSFEDLSRALAPEGTVRPFEEAYRSTWRLEASGLKEEIELASRGTYTELEEGFLQRIRETHLGLEIAQGMPPDLERLVTFLGLATVERTDAPVALAEFRPLLKLLITTLLPGIEPLDADAMAAREGRWSWQQEDKAVGSMAQGEAARRILADFVSLPGYDLLSDIR